MPGQPWSRPAGGAGLGEGLLGHEGASASSSLASTTYAGSGELLEPLQRVQKTCAERCESAVFWACTMVGYVAAAVWITDEFIPDNLPDILKPKADTQKLATHWLVGVGVGLSVLLAAALARRRHCRFWELLLPFLFRRAPADASNLQVLSYRGRMFMGYLWAFCMLASLLSLPFVVYVMMTINQRLQHVAVLVCFVFAFLATVLSVREVMKHLMNYSSPRLQLHYIRILWMVPIYAITAAVTLRFEQKAIILNAAREA
jgi:hypothetical protein